MTITKKYSKLIVEHPFIVILFSLIISLICFNFYSLLIVDNPSVDEIIDEKYEVVKSIQKLSDNLGGGQSSAFMVVIELEPEYINNNIDIRDPSIVKYTKTLSNQILKIEDVTSTGNLGDLIYQLNNNQPINDINEIKKLTNNNPSMFDRIINDKYSLTVIRIYANEGFDVKLMQKEVQKIIENTPMPIGVDVQLAGEQIAGQISQDLTGPDSQKTSMISLLAIILILLITFRHPIYSTLPLFTIIFGVIWVFGFMAISGIRITNFSSGAISMIIGIGIDFGIQTIMRFKQELATAKPVLAMEKTLQNVLSPMFITTIASFIGFWAMTYGDFIILGELGKIMALGVVFCFFAAITIVPAISVLYEQYKPKRRLNSPLKIIKKLINLIRGKESIK